MDTGTEVEAQPKYKMTISRRTIENLGIKLYDRVSAVLSELVANAYDADSTGVKIALPLDTLLATKKGDVLTDGGYEIQVVDNGVGMSTDQVNSFYLRLGLNRRDRGDNTESGRKVMGRKGIGKLAPFGVCREIEVVTAGGTTENGEYVVSNFVMKLDDILQDTDSTYPPDIGPIDGTRSQNRGTTIILRNFERKRVPDANVLRRQLGARFGITRPDWKVTVVNVKNVNETFDIRGLDIPLMEDTKIDVSTRPIDLGEGRSLTATGWIAYAREAYRDEVMAGIRIFTRGKLAAQTRDFDVPSGFTGEYKMRSYIVGELHADWLDESDDLIRSDRQDIIWNSESGEAFRTWGQSLIKELASRAETRVNNRTWQDFLEKSGIQRQLMEVAPSDARFRQSILNAAQVLVNKSDREAILNDPDYVERRVQLAFAIGPHSDLLTTLEEIAKNPESLEAITALLEKARIVEIYSLGQVAQRRVDSVKQFKMLIGNPDTVEGELQKLVERAPWIVNPEWTPLSANRSLGRMRELFENWYAKTYGKPITTSAMQDPTKRPDFIMLNNEGCLEIIEIKRPSYSLTDEEYDRAIAYLDAVERFIEENDDIARQFPRANLTIICDEVNVSSAHSRQLSDINNILRKTWHDVLNNTMRAHEDFLEEVKRMRGLTSTSAATLGDSADS